MSISTPHDESTSLREEEEEVRKALGILRSTPQNVIERVMLSSSQSPANGFLSSMSRVLGFAQAVDLLSDALASLDTAVPPGVARAAQATENVWRQVDEEFGLLSSTEVAQRLGASRSNRGYASSLRKRGALAGIERKNAFQYPGFQLDPEAHKIRSWVKPLLSLAQQCNRSASDALVWMVAPSTHFDGARPVDHLNNDERILAGAARSWGTEW